MVSEEQRNRRRLEHIVKSCCRIISFVEGMELKDFLSSRKTQDAVIYQLIIAGEAVVNIDNDVLEKYDYPWFKVRAFRNYAAHQYFDIEIWTVWEIAYKEVPELLEIVRLILQNEF